MQTYSITTANYMVVHDHVHQHKQAVVVVVVGGRLAAAHSVTYTDHPQGKAGNSHHYHFGDYIKDVHDSFHPGNNILG